MNKILTVMLMVIMSLCMMSCGGDDEKEDEPTGGSSAYEKMIVGEWRVEQDGYYEIYTFNAGGTGEMVGFENGMYADDFEWTLSDTMLTFDFGGNDVSDWIIVSMSSKLMVLRSIDGRTTEYYTRMD